MTMYLRLLGLAAKATGVALVGVVSFPGHKLFLWGQGQAAAISAEVSKIKAELTEEAHKPPKIDEGRRHG